MSAADICRQLRATLEAARAMPMSASAVVNRTEMLELVSRLEAALGGGLSLDSGPGERLDPGVRDAKSQAAQLIEAAKTERARLLDDTEIINAARNRAAQLRAEAEQETAELRMETDDYVDGRLAILEMTLTKTLEAISRGRERLQGRSLFAQLAPPDNAGQPATDADLGSAKPSR